MEKMEQILITPTLKTELQKQIKKYQNDNPKKQGFNEIVTIVGLGFMTKGGIAKINSFFNTKTSSKEDQEKAEVYGATLRAFCSNYIAQEKNKTAISNKLRTSTGHPTGAKTGKQQGRTVDRMNTINTTGTKPPSLMELYNEVQAEGLTMKQYRVTYSINGKQRITTTLPLYSASETMAIEQLRKRNTGLRSKAIVILTIAVK